MQHAAAATQNDFLHLCQRLHVRKPRAAGLGTSSDPDHLRLCFSDIAPSVKGSGTPLHVLR